MADLVGISSLRGRLLALLLPFALFALGINVVAVLLIVQRVSHESLDQGLADAVALYVTQLREQPANVSGELPAAAQRVLLALPEDRVFFTLQDAEGRVLAGDPRLADELPWGTLEAPAYFDLNHQGYWLRGISIVFEAGGAARQLTLATTALKREQLMREIMLGMVAPQVLLLLVTMVLVWAAVGRGLAPLADLRAEIGSRSHEDLRPLAAEAAPDELKPVVAEINRLFGRLAQAIEGQRHFIADAAHQLRTPVAALLAQLESADSAASSALVAGARRLARLVGQLLALSRTGPGMVSAEGSFDFAAMIREAANDWLPQAFRRGMEIEFEIDALNVAGSEHAYREMLANVVDNAIRYGRRGGRIVVRCRAEGSDAVIQVDDDGPGIPDDEREKVFERFYRGAGAKGEEGCGLGLAIVRALAESQDAKLSLGNTPAGIGLRVEIRARVCSRSCDGGAGGESGCDARRGDAAICQSRQESQRGSAPDSPRPSGLRPETASAALSDLPRGRPWAAPSALRPSASGRQRQPPDD